jgi:hypothetical protein
MNYSHLNKIQKRLVSGLLAEELGPQAAPATARPGVFTPTASSGCAANRGNNVQVNQNCLNLSDPTLQGRAQAQNETWMTSDPNNPSHLVASYNDYRRGDGTCGTTYSMDGGKTWHDSTTPNGFTAGTAFGAAREYWQAGGDTSVAYDTKGNAYLSCQLFQRGQPTTPNPDQSSGFFVFRSTGNAGASWNFTGRPAIQHAATSGPDGVLIDKALLTVDDSKTSRFMDRVYVSWTTFAADGTAYIYEAYSKDYGESFSPPVLVSRDSGRCPNTYGLPTPNGRCNENQFSDPFTGPDGTLYVVYANYNNNTTEPAPPGGGDKANPNENFNQMLISRSTDGGRSFSSPVQAGRYYDLPDCATYQGGQDAGRACVPEKASSTNSVFRATNLPTGAVDPLQPNKVVVTYGSYINQHSQESTGCSPIGFSPTTGQNLFNGVKTGGCNNDIVISTSIDAGHSFSGTGMNPRQMPVVTTGSKQGTTDQWWQAEAFSSTGTLAVSYYDRSYGSDEITGYSDMTLSTSTDLMSFANTRATSSSMPPPTEFSGLFYGDYTGIAVAGSTAYPIWSDTRQTDLFLCPGSGTPGHPPLTCAMTAPNAPLANDQEISTVALPIP